TPQFLDQPILMRAMVAFHSTFGLWRTGSDDADAQLGAHAPKLRQWRLAGLFVRFAGGGHIDVLPVRVQSLGNAIVLNPEPQQVRSRQVVSCFPSWHKVVPVASSTRFIRQPSGPRSSNQPWKLPSNCTSSPKCALRSRRLR